MSVIVRVAAVAMLDDVQGGVPVGIYTKRPVARRDVLVGLDRCEDRREGPFRPLARGCGRRNGTGRARPLSAATKSSQYLRGHGAGGSVHSPPTGVARQDEVGIGRHDIELFGDLAASGQRRGVGGVGGVPTGTGRRQSQRPPSCLPSRGRSVAAVSTVAPPSEASSNRTPTGRPGPVERDHDGLQIRRMWRTYDPDRPDVVRAFCYELSQRDAHKDHLGRRHGPVRRGDRRGARDDPECSNGLRPPPTPSCHHAEEVVTLDRSQSAVNRRGCR